VIRFWSFPAALAIAILVSPCFADATGNAATQDGCQSLANTADEIVSEQPDIDPHEFIRALAYRVAGIHPGPKGIIDLAQGGENVVAGTGFKPVFDDGTGGQARHFAGTAGSVERFGSPATLMAGETVLRDPADSPDGRLSRAAIVFATKLLDGDLAPGEAGFWIRQHVCAEQD
jgi:hypothetical protein